MEKTLVVLGGPTASGKTACAIKLAKHFRSEIISADSRQLYRETSIGTAVPAPEELAAVPHHFIHCTSLEDPYNASRFEMDVLEKLKELFRDHDLLFLVGGSGLYIDAVCQGIDDLPAVDQQLRDQLQQRLKQEGLEVLLEELKKLDPKSYERVDRNNHLRVLKALEVSLQTGKPYSSFLSHKKKQRPFRILKAALNMEREKLYDRINMRVELMMEAGLLEEARSVLSYRQLTPMKTVGYREMFRHLDGEISFEEAVDLIQRNTRKFARKQITWFRKNEAYTWFTPDRGDQIIRWIAEV